jgi:hypothetical protein
MEGTKAQRPLEKAVYSDSMELLINQLKNEIVGQLNEQISNEISKIYR